MQLFPWQKEAVTKLDTGRVLYGEVGSGKSIATLAYYVEKEAPAELIVITTAKKRDTGDWQQEARLFGMEGITVDSWNNILNYIDRKGCFFIFDEQRLVGNGQWVKNFQRIAKANRWVLLSGTPGDTWMDYAPIFIANGFYRNITHFISEHVLYEPYVKYPKVKDYFGVEKLEVLRNELLVEMPAPRHTKRYVNWMPVDHNADRLAQVFDKRWNVYEQKPIKDASEMWRVGRRVINEDASRLSMIAKLHRSHPRLIIFYNFDYELDILRLLGTTHYQWFDGEFEVAEYNGHRHDPLPVGESWIYLVQYTSGAEGWNCTSTDAMVFYSLTYSWKNFEQCQGRIDRLNTDFTDLYYYVLVSNTVIDRQIRKALDTKHRFNERKAALKVAGKRPFEEVELDELEREFL